MTKEGLSKQNRVSNFLPLVFSRPADEVLATPTLLSCHTHIQVIFLISKTNSDFSMMMNVSVQQRLLVIATAVATAFLLSSSTTVEAFVIRSPTSTTTTTSTLFHVKGFGEKPAPKVKSEGQIKREAERKRYDELAKTGQEYSIFVRQFGSDDKAWLPCGAIAVPRGSQVSDAIYANENDLKAAIVRTYPKLRGFENEFEFGYNLKVYPDDPVEVAVKGKPKESGISLGNWISTLLSPVDASSVKPVE